MDVQSAYREVGTYRGAAEIWGVTHKTVKRVVEAMLRDGPDLAVAHNYDAVADLVAERVVRTKGRISAKRLCRSPTSSTRSQRWSTSQSS